MAGLNLLKKKKKKAPPRHFLQVPNMHNVRKLWVSRYVSQGNGAMSPDYLNGVAGLLRDTLQGDDDLELRA